MKEKNISFASQSKNSSYEYIRRTSFSAAQPRNHFLRYPTMKPLFTTLILFFGLGLYAQIPFVQAEQINAWRTAQTDSVYVVNFWATWCTPCVEEMPDLLKLQQDFAAQKVKLILVSNDFKKHIDTKLVPFVQEHHLEPYVVYMNEPTPNDWINSVNPEWSGAIPTTWILNPATGKETFHEGKMAYGELEALLRSVLD